MTDVDSIIAANLTIEGNVKSAGEVQVEGRIKGDVHVKRLVLGEGAEIIGDIHSEEVLVRGRVIGNIQASKVELCASSQVEGTILHQTISIEMGARFQGDCRHSGGALQAVVRNAAASTVK